MLIRRYSYKNKKGCFPKKQPLFCSPNCLKCGHVKFDEDIIQYIFPILMYR